MWGQSGEAPTAARRPAAWRRGLAWLVDFSLVLAAAVGLGIFTFNRISAMVTDVPGLVEKGAWQVITSGGDLEGAGEDFGRAVWNDAIGAVQQGFALLVLATFLYQWLALAFTGTTLGKASLGLRVVARDGGRLGRGRAARRAAVTTIADVGVFSLACCLLLSGGFALSAVVWLAAIALFWANALPSLVGPGRSLADRAAGGAVTGGLLRAAATATAAGTRAVITTGRDYAADRFRRGGEVPAAPDADRG
ncbi:RDD family protein [Streptomyces sp. 6N223]|uniref:RDD family protein n=1 Tax=Streptomyces sp. 6N223 TaxID=3457412 RepID=UPI003FD04594